MRGEALIAAFPDGERRRLLAAHGCYPLSAQPAEIDQRFRALVTARPTCLLEAAFEHPGDLHILWRAATAAARYPGRAEALLVVVRALGLSLPESEYALPEHALESLLERARAATGRRIPVQGKEGHKGRVGDGIERLLIGGKVIGRKSDHPLAEIKSVPVRGGKVIERVKLGVVSATSNPLDKCGRVLFVFVEQRGDDHFVRGHHLAEFDGARFQAMWRDGFIVETAAGSPRFPARGLYLTPKWFQSQRIWPSL